MKIDWIEPNILAASGVPVGIKDLTSLYDQGVRAIVTLTEHPITIQSEISDDYLNESSFNYLHAPIVDQYPPEDVETVWQVVQFIDLMQQQAKPVLIHCQAGVGRTGTMLHAYYLAKGIPLQDAQLKIKRSRSTCQFIMLTPEQQTFLLDFAEEN